MAFNKDRDNLEKTPRFGSKEMRETLAALRPVTKKTQGNFGPYIRNLILTPAKPYKIIIHDKLHTNEVLEEGKVVVRHLPYYRTFQHWVNHKNRFGICSAPLYQDRDMQAERVKRCGGCAAYAAQWVQVRKGGKEVWENQGPISRANECFNFSVTVIGPFYEVASSKINPKTGMPYPEFVLRHDKRVQDAIASKKLEQLATVPAQKFIWSLSRKDTAILFGDPTLEPGTSIDDKLNHICTACLTEEAFLESNRDKKGVLTCSACGADEDARMGLLGKVLSIQAAVTQPPTKPGGRPKTVLQLTPTKELPQGWAPIPEELLGTEYMEAVDLKERCYPLPAEYHYDLYGYTPELTETGASTALVDSKDDDIGFLAEPKAPCRGLCSTPHVGAHGDMPLKRSRYALGCRSSSGRMVYLREQGAPAYRAGKLPS